MENEETQFSSSYILQHLSFCVFIKVGINDETYTITSSEKSASKKFHFVMTRKFAE